MTNLCENLSYCALAAFIITVAVLMNVEDSNAEVLPPVESKITELEKWMNRPDK